MTYTNSYNGSSKHRENLEKARQAGLEKVACSYCSVERGKGRIKQHERSCYLNPSNKKLCVVCEDPIKNFRTSTTCGYACSNTHFRSGPNSANWKEESYRTTCFHHHEKKCVVCDERNIVTVHHLDENRNNNDPENLVPLCPTHHQYWHSRFRPQVEAQVLAYIDAWKNRQ